MSEPESLAVDESLDRHIARHAYDRLLMLSDGVFAIATTLAALEIHLPEGVKDPARAFKAMGRPLVAYAISFVVIAIFWISHRDLFARVRVVDKRLTAITLGFLFGISLIPMGIGGMSQGNANAGFRIYAFTMMSCGVLNAAMWNYAAFARGVMRPELPKAYRLERSLGSVAMPLLFLPFATLSLDRVDVILGLVAVVIFLRRVVLRQFLRRKYG